MRLFYRGIPYESTSPEIPTLETGMAAQYRGVSYPLRYAPTAPHYHAGLVYRGISIDRGFKGNFLGYTGCQ